MQEKWYREPLIRTQLDYIKKQLMSDVNWLNKASWKLNKTLKGIFFCKISFQEAQTVVQLINNIQHPFNT